MIQDPVFYGTFASIPGLTISPSNTMPWPAVEPGCNADSRQRMTYSYDIAFSSNSLASFPAMGSSSTLSLTVTIRTSAAGFGAPTTTAQFELVGGADPYFCQRQPAAPEPIPASTLADILPSELDTFAIFKWRLSLTPLSNRWYPVLPRYISFAEGRITVQPSPYKPPPTGLFAHRRRPRPPSPSSQTQWPHLQDRGPNL